MLLLAGAERGCGVRLQASQRVLAWGSLCACLRCLCICLCIYLCVSVCLCISLCEYLSVHVCVYM